MKILLVHPSNATVYNGIKKTVTKLSKKDAKTPPIGIMYVAAVLEKEGYEVQLLDAEAENLDFDTTVNKIKDYGPDVVGFTATTPLFPLGIKIAETLKKNNLNIKTVFGGPHISALPQESLAPKAVDFVVIGEGEYSMLELIKEIEGEKNFAKVKGIGYKEAGLAIINPKRELIQNLDELPFPTKHLTNQEKYLNLYTGKPYALVVTSRGCPFNCIFCDSKITFGRRTRYRSPENVIKELKQIVDIWEIKDITFTDDTFTLNRERTIELCKRIIEENLNISFICSSRADTIDEERLKWLKKAGCRQITFGLESGDDKILQIIKKGITTEDAKRAIALTKSFGIETHASYMLGNPGETLKTMNKTIEFAQELNTDFAQFSIATPFPGTEMWDMAVRDGLIDSNTDFSRFTWYYSPVFKSKEFDREKLIGIQREAYAEYAKKIKKTENKYHPSAWIIGEPDIGEGTWVGAFTIIDGSGGLKIGKQCDISCGAQIYTHSSVKRCVSGTKFREDGSINRDLLEKKSVSIGDYTFIGPNSTIIMGVQIGKHCIIGAGAVVVSDVPDHAVVAGNPAKIKKFVCQCSNDLKEKEIIGIEKVMKCESCGKEIIIKKEEYEKNEINLQKNKIPLAKPYFGLEELKEIEKVLDSRWVSDGPEVRKFEKKTAEYLGINHAVAVSNCTAALHLSLLALGIKEGDEVLVADYTFPATSHAVLFCRAKPVFIDIDPKTYNINPELIEEKITEKTKAIIPVHTFGQAADMDPIMEIARKHNLYVIEDAACAFGAEYKGRLAGTIGDIGCFSFHARKGISTGEGGLAVTNNETLAKKIKKSSIFGMTSALERENQKEFFVPEFVDIGHNYKMSDVLAAMGVVQLDRLEGIIRKKRELAEEYKKQLYGVKGITTPYENVDVKHIYQSYVVLLDKELDRNVIIKALMKKGIQTQIGTYSCHIQPVYNSGDKCPNSKEVFERALTLPMYYEMQKGDIEKVVQNLKEVLKENV